MFRISQVWAAITHLHSHASTTGQTSDDHHAQLHAAAHQTGSDKVATGTPDGTKFLRDDFAWVTPTAAAADIGSVVLKPTGSETLATNLSAVVGRSYTIASGQKLTVASGARFRIL